MEWETKAVSQRSGQWAVYASLAMAALALFSGWQNSGKLASFQAVLAQQAADERRLGDMVNAELGRLKESQSAAEAQYKSNLQQVGKSLEGVRADSTSATRAAQAEARRHANELAQQLREEQQKREEEIAATLAGVEQKAGQASTGVKQVDGKIGEVRTEMETTRGEIRETAGRVRQLSGRLDGVDMVVRQQAGDIRSLYEQTGRDVTSFLLDKSQEKRVGHVSLLLRRSDPRKRTFTILVRADEGELELKDKGPNAPLPFYLSRSPQPYEVVVTDVKKDLVIGFVAAPQKQYPRKAAQ